MLTPFSTRPDYIESHDGIDSVEIAFGYDNGIEFEAVAE